MSYEQLGEDSERLPVPPEQAPTRPSTGSIRRSSSASVASRASSLLRPRPDESLVEPLTENGGDPFYVFRSDLFAKLDLVDESLAEFLRVVHQTVSAYVL